MRKRALNPFSFLYRNGPAPVVLQGKVRNIPDLFTEHMNASDILEGLSPSEKRLLLALERENGTASPEDLFELGGFERLVEVMNSASWLQSKGLIRISEIARKQYSLKDRDTFAKGLPEHVEH